MNHASLFSGIGGFDLAAEWMGWTNIFNCDIEEFPRKVLKYHFPNAKQYADIKQTDFTIHRGQVDILTGGFPCQPFSMAGKRLGKNDERHLWPEMLRAIREIKPKWIVGENVRGLLGWNDGLVFDEVQTDLEVEGYEVQSFILPASAINAPHRRDRVWIVAYSNSSIKRNKQRKNIKEEREVRRNEKRDVPRGLSSNGDASNSDNAGLKAQRIQKSKLGKKSKRKAFGRNRNEPLRGTERWESFPTQSPVCGGDDGIPRELDAITFSKWRRESIKGYGNAIVPQIAYRIFQAIEYVELDTNLRTIL
jgi:DNA (cytosine-5)-methyltransferase 1